jgi:hypothetical protein
MTPAELLALITKTAPGLRKAGVSRVTLIGICSFTTGDDDPGEARADDEEPDDLNPLSDPLTYGMQPRAGRKLPSIKAGS